MVHGALAGFHAARWPRVCLSPARGIHRAGHDAAMAGARGRHGAVRAEAVQVRRPGASIRSECATVLRECVQVLERRDSGTHSLQARAFAKGSELRQAPVGHAWSTRRVRAGGSRGVRLEYAWGTRGVQVHPEGHRPQLPGACRLLLARAALAHPVLVARASLPAYRLLRTHPAAGALDPRCALPAAHTPLRSARAAAAAAVTARSGRMRSLAGLWGAGRPLLPVSCGRRRVY